MKKNDVLCMMRTARKLYEAMFNASNKEEAETTWSNLDAFLDNCQAAGVSISLGCISTWAFTDGTRYEMGNDTFELV